MASDILARVGQQYPKREFGIEMTTMNRRYWRLSDRILTNVIRIKMLAFLQWAFRFIQDLAHNYFQAITHYPLVGEGLLE